MENPFGITREEVLNLAAQKLVDAYVRVDKEGRDAALTVGQLKRQLAALNVPDDATLKTASGKNWLWTSNMSFCRTMNEVSLW